MEFIEQVVLLVNIIFVLSTLACLVAVVSGFYRRETKHNKKLHKKSVVSAWTSVAFLVMASFLILLGNMPLGSHRHTFLMIWMLTPFPVIISFLEARDMNLHTFHENEKLFVENWAKDIGAHVYESGTHNGNDGEKYTIIRLKKMVGNSEFEFFGRGGKKSDWYYVIHKKKDGVKQATAMSVSESNPPPSIVFHRMKELFGENELIKTWESMEKHTFVENSTTDH